MLASQQSDLGVGALGLSNVGSVVVALGTGTPGLQARLAPRDLSQQYLIPTFFHLKSWLLL